MTAPSDSDVALCNRALTRLSANQITSLDQESREARLLKANFEFLRDDVNAAHAWGFALKQANLAQDAGTPEWGATYQYTIPDDLLGFITEKNELQGIDQPYRILGDYIVTNATEVKIEYVSRVTDMNKWHTQAKEALIARLMAEIGPAITERFNSVQGLYNVYLEKLSLAGSYNGAEVTPRELIVDTWLGSRWGGTDYGGMKVSDF